MSETPIVTSCVSDLEAKLTALANINKCIFVYTAEELLDKTKGLPISSATVSVGVMYEGMKRNQPTPSNGSKTSTASTALSVAIIVVTKPDKTFGAAKEGICAHMDAIRNAINRTKSPTSHPWIFDLEAPVVEDKDSIVWVQRWTTACSV